MVQMILFFLASMWCIASHAADSSGTDVDYQRRRWSLTEGAPQQVYLMAQSSDGLLWMGSITGLYSFDGMRFRLVNSVLGLPLHSSIVSSLLPLPGGGLATGYPFGGVSLYTRTGAKHYKPGEGFPFGKVVDLTQDTDGRIYAVTSNALVFLHNGQWQSVGEDSLPSTFMRQALFDRENNLWLLIEESLYLRAKNAKKFVKVSSMISSDISLSNGMLTVRMRGPKGEGWYRFNGPSPIRIKIDAPERVNSLLDGGSGTLWALSANELQHLVPSVSDGLRQTQLFPYDFDIKTPSMQGGLLDREGNMWIYTSNGGVERLRPHRFQRVKTSNKGSFWLAQAGLGNEVWLGGEGGEPLVRILPSGSRLTTRIFKPNHLLRASSNHVWVGTDSAVWEFDGEKSRQWPLPIKGRDVQSLAIDKEGRLLVSIVREGLWTLANGSWQRDSRMSGVQEAIPISMVTTATGQTWLGLTNNRLGLLTRDSFKLLPNDAGVNVGNVVTLFESEGNLLAGGDNGLAAIINGKAYAIRFKSTESAKYVSGIVADGGGNLWVHSSDGLYRISAKQMQEFWRAPEQLLEAELFNFEDGVRGMASGNRPLPSLSIANNGRLYYATVSDVGWIDPLNIKRNSRAPDVLIESVRTQQKTYLQPNNRLVFPERTTTVAIEFAISALSIPERVRMKYRLSDVDEDWHDVQLERVAHYTNLNPGHYRFQVIAANEDGVWNQQGAVIEFDIRPTVWQTSMFQFFCVSVLFLSAFLLYRWRVSVVKRHAISRADERAAANLEATLDERKRIARSLHDNLLQAVQALILLFHSMQIRMPKEAEMQTRIDEVLSHAEGLVASTRDEVIGLRQKATFDDMFAGLELSITQAVPHMQGKLSFSVKGESRPLREEVVSEVLSVLREAILNSAAHAQASRVEVTVVFGDDAFCGEVADNGVGISPNAAKVGSARHWGILGMRERIARVEGSIEIGPGSHGGVVIRFSIPCAQAYRTV
jgi:signal transduction histidine kinase/ligand-binding sensor domain-containing protein